TSSDSSARRAICSTITCAASSRVAPALFCATVADRAASLTASMPTTSRGSGRSNNALIVVVIPAPQPSYIERIYETTCPRPVAQVFEHSSAQASGHPLGQHVRTRVHAVDPRVARALVSRVGHVLDQTGRHPEHRARRRDRIGL